MLNQFLLSVAGLLIVVVVAGLLLVLAIVLAFVLACLMLATCQALNGKFCIIHRIELLTAKSQKATRCKFVVPPLMGYLGVQFGAWDWSTVSTTLLNCHGGYVAHLWKEQKQKQLFLRRHKVWRKGRGKGKGKSGQSNSGNSSGRFGNYR